MADQVWQTIGLPAQIDALFMEAALDRVEAVAMGEGGTLQGHFHLPDGPAQIVFHAEAPPRVADGALLRFEVWSATGGLRFEARVRAVSGRRVCLDRPRLVQAADRRRAWRLSMDGIVPSGLIPGPRPEQAAWTLRDLSVTGLRFGYDPRREALQPGQRVGAWLALPDHAPMSVEIQIVHLGRGPLGPEAGARISVMTARARLQLHRFLETQRRTRAA